jgi:hypothetical protein
MKTSFWRSAMAVSLLTVFAACGDSEVVRDPSAAANGGKSASAPGAVHVGMPLDSVYAVIGTGSFTGTGPADTIRVMHGHRARMVVTNNRIFRVLFVRKETGTLDGPIERSKDTPILLENQKVLGNGWADYDRLTKELSLPPLDTKP